MSKKVEISIIALLIIFAFYCALSIGSSWDEIFEMTRGEERLKYLFSPHILLIIDDGESTVVLEHLIYSLNDK